jgi:uncharacterized repeat protein (TIGR03803 family)
MRCARVFILQCCIFLTISAAAECADSTASAVYILKTLVNFNATDGAGPDANLIADSSDNLYGTTVFGGTADDGTVFEVANNANHTLSTLATFNGTNGGFPEAGLIADGNGNLFGTTNQLGVGTNDDGTVFEVANNASHTLSTLATFTGMNGAGPNASLTSDASANLYGTTSGLGFYSSNAGTVFELATGTRKVSTLVTFNGANGTGAYPYAGMIADSSGNLYGTTSGGGTNNDGTVFKVATGTHKLTTLATFDGTNGANPESVLLADSSGNLYGTTTGGGANSDGTVFEVAAGTHTLSTLVTFNGTNGKQPYASLIADANGNLYGTTSSGGANGDGTVFEVAAGTHTLITLVTFNGTNGQQPYASLIADASGNLYGTTNTGGANDDGTVFELSPVRPGDFNLDSHIDPADIPAMEQALANMSTYQTANGLSAAQLLAIGDINGDGVVNNADLQALLDLLNSGGGSSNSVPEPPSIVLLGIGALAIAYRRRRR